jgi:hypothetical protein
MINIVERMDRLRTQFLKAFVITFGSIIGFWIIFELLLALMRPKNISSLGSSRPIWERYINFLYSVELALKICLFAGLVVLGISLVGWLLYKRKLARNPAINTAVRDERVRLIWLLAFRRTVAAVITLQLILWILQNLTPFFMVRSPITPHLDFFLTLFVLVLTSLGTFLSLDRRATILGQEGESTHPPFLFCPSSLEATIIHKAPSLLRLYLGWHALFIIGMVFWNWMRLHMNGSSNDPRILRFYEISRGALLAWFAVLAVLVYRLLFSFKKARQAALKTPASDDERVQTNWLRACRFSFLVVLSVQIVWAAGNFIFVGLLARVFARSPFFLNGTFYLSGLRLNLLAAVATLLGSYLYFDRKE